MQRVPTLVCAVLLLAGSTQAQTRQAHPAPRSGTKVTVKRPTATPKVAAKATSKPANKPASAPVLVAATPVVAAPVARPAVAPAHATSPLFQAGTNMLNVGVGFGLGYGYSNLGNTSATPALSVSYMRGLANAGPGTISAGGIVGYKSFSWQDGAEKATLRNIYVGARGAYHYGFGIPKLDTYAGVGLGVRVASYSYTYTTNATASGSQAELSGFAGAGYFFSDKVGAFSELGYDMSYLKVGLSARF